MDSTGASERHQNNNVKVLHHFVNYLGKDIFSLSSKVVIQSFLFLRQRKKPRMKTLKENDLDMGSLLAHN